MKVSKYFKKFIEKIAHKKSSPLLLASPKSLYADLIHSPEIEAIISGMPPNLSKLEKAYYIYLELGKLVNESPHFVFANMNEKFEHYNDTIDANFYGICKSISELYVSILKDKRIGISADLIMQSPDSQITHVDTVLKINGKNFLVNLISDLSRIKTSRRVNSFGVDLRRPINNPRIAQNNADYLRRLEQHYGKIDCLSRAQVEDLDKKLGYCFFIRHTPDGDIGYYTEDTIELLRRDMDNPESFRKYVLHDKDVPREDIFRHKIEYIFDHMDHITTYNGHMGYLERIRYYEKIASKLLSPQELSRVQAYAATINGDLSNIISILKISPLNGQGSNLYYMYSQEEKKYVHRTPEEMRQFLNGLDRNSLQIIGTFDRFNPRGIDALEL